jgi:hypothetical protein
MRTSPAFRLPPDDKRRRRRRRLLVPVPASAASHSRVTHENLQFFRSGRALLRMIRRRRRLSPGQPLAPLGI